LDFFSSRNRDRPCDIERQYNQRPDIAVTNVTATRDGFMMAE